MQCHQANVIKLNLDGSVASKLRNGLDGSIVTSFSSSFDNVSHRRLILKLETYGINENVLRWIENWLCGKNGVVHSGQVSDWCELLSSGPGNDRHSGR